MNFTKSEIIKAIALCNKGNSNSSYEERHISLLIDYEYSNKGTNVWIAFRGSDSIFDWLYNLNMNDGIYPYGKDDMHEVRMHEGFSKAYFAVRTYLLQYISALLLQQVDNIYLTGHSLGGAIATIAAVDLQYNRGISPRVIAFGCPKTGNKAWVRSVIERVPAIIYIENTHDPIPYIPCKFYNPDIKYKFSKFSLNPHSSELYQQCLV